MGDTIKAREDGVVRREWSRGYFARNCTSFRHNTLKPAIHPLLSDSVPTSQGTRRTTSFLLLFRKVKSFYSENIREYINTMGDRGGRVVKVLCYKSEGHWVDPSWCHWNFSLTYNPSNRTPTEMSTRSIS